MDVTSDSAAVSGRSSTGVDVAGSQPARASAISSDFETFLKMLTVQMENQDPLNPIQSADFAVQLATFSGVEQQVRTNELLQSLTSDQTMNGLADYAGWVGQEVRAPVPAEYDGSPVELYFALPSEADRATLTVRDGDGSVVTQIAISPGTDGFEWDGTDAGGATVAPGQYSFALDTRSGDTLLGTVVPETYAAVREVRLEDGSPVLIMKDGAAIAASDVTGIRPAASE